MASWLKRFKELTNPEKVEAADTVSTPAVMPLSRVGLKPKAKIKNGKVVPIEVREYTDERGWHALEMPHRALEDDEDSDVHGYAYDFRKR